MSNLLEYGTTKQDIKASLRDIPKLRTNNSYPTNELDEWERKFNHWLPLFDSSEV